ncbi:MAG: T9SS type A sorting domain-containing protein, partial [Bacteroidia bacterium]|nr:T9SS type A sorting domain-containing protein [Bacteroidia bacterium]
LSTVAIKIANENDIVGIQMSMALKGIDIINVESNFGLTDSHYKITPEHFVLSYTDVTGSEMNDEATIFLDVIPKGAVNISEALVLDEKILLPEIYKGKNLTVHPINLIFDSNDVDNFVGTNYPNPFVQNTTIEVMASENKEGVIKLYDFNGRMLMNRNIDLIKGINKIQINHTDLGLYSGIILYEITTDSGFTRGRMLRIEK